MFKHNIFKLKNVMWPGGRGLLFSNTLEIISSSIFKVNLVLLLIFHFPSPSPIVNLHANFDNVVQQRDLLNDHRSDRRYSRTTLL